ncbi:phage tail tip lysozyme [Bradyrhizobium sp. S3.7.6]
MAENQQQMELVAKLTDQVSDKLKEIQKQMIATAAAAKKSNEGSSAASKAYQKQVADVESVLRKHHDNTVKRAAEHKKRIEEVGEALSQMVSGQVISTLVGMTTRFGAIGVAVGIAYEGIQRMTEALEKMGKESQSLFHLRRATDMSAEAFQKLENTMGRLGVQKGDAQSGIIGFSDFHAKLKRGSIKALEQMEGGDAPVGATSYARGLKRMSTEEATNTIIRRILGSNNTVEQKEMLLQTFRLPTGLATSKLSEYDEEKHKSVAKIKEHDVDRYKEAQDASEDATDRADKLKSKFTAAFTEPRKEMNEFFSEMLKKIDEATDHTKHLDEAIRGAAGGLFRGALSGIGAGPLAPLAIPGAIGGAIGGAAGPLLNERKQEETIKKGTMQGILDGMRQFLMEHANPEMLKPGGLFQPTAFHPDGGNVSPGRGFGSKDYPLVPSTGGEFKGPQTGKAKAAIMDQLRKEGVPEANLEYAASALTGQAISESGLNPNTSHDGGTGYGIYGARLGRAKRMLSWLKENGYAHNDLEGQSRYMAHEAMTDQAYAASRRALMGATAGNLGQVNGVLTDNFEAPAVRNYGRRLRDTGTALRSGHVEGSNAAKGIGIGDANLADLDPEFMGRMNALWAAAPDEAKKGAGIISGKRSYEEQAELYRRYRSGRGGIAAPPGRSRHESGSAADWRDPTGWFHEHANEYGLHFPMGRRDWPHMQMDPRFDGSLLPNGQKSGMFGNGMKVTGDASVKIALEGFPRGTRTQVNSSGIFKDVSLNRGRSMGLASEDA